MTGYASIDKPWLKYYKLNDLNNNMPHETIYSYLYSCCCNHINDIALVYFKRKITYGELLNNIDYIAQALTNDGVKPGDVVTVCSILTPETIYCIYACSKIGAICNIIEPRVNTESIVARIKNTNTKVLFILDAFYEKIKDYVGGWLKTVVIRFSYSMDPFSKLIFGLTKGLKIPKPKYSTNVVPYCRYVCRHDSSQFCKPEPYKPNNTAVIIYTSGTTSVPKGAMLSDDSVNAIAIQFLCSFCVKRNAGFLNIMPPFVSYGLMCGIHSPLCADLKMIIIPAFKPARFADYILRYKPEYFIGVPSHFERLIHSKKMQKMDLSFVNVAAMGGDSLNLELEQEIEAFFISHNAVSGVFKGYGMTEMSSAVTNLSPLTGNKMGSVGIPLIYTVVAIFEPGTDHELRYGETGEICLNGPGMMTGYFKNKIDTDKVIKRHSDGLLWVHTQDVGYMDENGFLYFQDRIKRVIARPDGHKVWPSAIEQVLSRHNAVKECAVVGTSNPEGKNGKIPTAFVVKDPKNTITNEDLEKELRQMSKEALSERDCAIVYYFIESLPMTIVGKIDYKSLESFCG